MFAGLDPEDWEDAMTEALADTEPYIDPPYQHEEKQFLS